MTVAARARIALIATGVMLASCQRRIPAEYEYPQGWITEEHRSLTAGSLSGVAADPSGAPVQYALVERMTPDFKTRLDATLTDKGGRFHFRGAHKGTFYLRFRYRGFNDYLVAVRIVPGADNQPLQVRLELSD
jgi:hypothetical protein